MSSNNCVSFVMTHDYFPNTDVTARLHVLPPYTYRNLVTEVRLGYGHAVTSPTRTSRPAHTFYLLIPTEISWQRLGFGHAVTSPTRTSRPRYTIYLLVLTEISWQRLEYGHVVTNTFCPKYYDKD